MDYFFVLLAACCWGPSYLFIKIALTGFSPFLLMLGRVSIAFIFVLPFCYAQFYSYRRSILSFAILGLTLNALPQTLICYGELSITSALAGILNSCTLIFTAILGHFLKHDFLTKKKIFGIALGLAGLLVIYVPLLFSEHKDQSPLGASLIILSSLSYAIGSLYARKHLKNTPTPVALAYQLLTAAMMLVPFAAFQTPSSPPPAAALFSLISLGLIGTALAYYFYFKAIEYCGPTYASFTSLLVPIFAMIVGLIFLQETIYWNAYLGLFFILAGLFSINLPQRKST